jgi:non-homologous end joining protein Ku
MKIRFIFAYEHIINKQKTLLRPDEIHDLDDETAKKLIKQGIAEHASKAAANTPPTAP